MRFVENHDEPRLAATLPRPAARAAAVVALTLPGVALLHEGQEVGRRVRVPVTLGRRPVEAPDAELARVVRAGCGRRSAPGCAAATWALVDVEGWPDNRSCEHLVAWTWIGPDARYLVVVNLSDDKADGRIRLARRRAAPIVLTDALTGERYLRDGATVGSDGLYVALAPHGAHMLRLVSGPRSANFSRQRPPTWPPLRTVRGRHRTRGVGPGRRLPGRGAAVDQAATRMSATSGR